MSFNHGVIRKILFLMVVSYSLDCCSGCCNDETCQEYETTGISLEVFDNSGPQPVVSVNDTINAIALLLQLKLEMDTTQCLSENYYDQISLTPLARAFSCGQVIYQDTIADILIYADADFNSEYPAGADLSELFVTSGDLQSPYYREEEYDFYLFSEPDSMQSFRFFVQLSFTNGIVLTDSTNAVVIR